MSKRKTIKFIKIVVFVLLLLGVAVTAFYIVWLAKIRQMNVAGAAAGEKAMSESGRRAAETTNADDDYECRHGKAPTVKIGEKFSHTSSHERSARPSFRGCGEMRDPPQVGASHVEDDGPIPLDGGGMPSKELKPIQRKGVCVPGGIDSDF